MLRAGVQRILQKCCSRKDIEFNKGWSKNGAVKHALVTVIIRWSINNDTYNVT